jgi:23S rRNA-/tRNA-specific pseudouridylate synthase
MEILYEDGYLLVVSKEPGILTICTNRDESFTVENVLNDYVRKGCARSSKHVFVVHRLDRGTSGVLLFAKSGVVQQRLKEDWKSTEKYYLAAVRGHLKTKSGLFSSYLAENEDQFVHSKETPTLSFVKIKLLTGRKNQIRVQFAEHGHPVVGDSKYGDCDPFRERLCLHAKSIAFDHPHSGKRLFFGTPIPDVFARLAGGLDEPDWTDCMGPPGPVTDR